MKKPITTKKHVTVFNKQLTDSNLRIKSSLSTLGTSERGNDVLVAFRTFCETSGARDLDMSNQSALLALLREFTFGGRRDFLAEIPKAPDYRHALERIATAEHMGHRAEAFEVNANELDRVLLIARETLGRCPKCGGRHEESECGN